MEISLVLVLMEEEDEKVEKKTMMTTLYRFVSYAESALLRAFVELSMIKHNSLSLPPTYFSNYIAIK
jgi:hypothetical protein